MSKQKKPYTIIGALDTETTNIKDGLEYKAFPILFQIGLIDCPIEQIEVENANELITVTTFREHEKCYDCLENIIEKYKHCVPVILVHNLGFDIYSLAPWLVDKEVKVLAKTARKPISISILDDVGNPSLVFLDTLGLYMKSLERMGEECGMPKAVGDWNYSLIRTPETELTKEEEYYAQQDIKTLLVYTSYFLHLNPDINSGDLGKKIFTKTGIVRAKRLYHLGKLKNKNGQTVKRMWDTHNHTQQPKDDDELFTMHTCTRGGFTFCAKNNASKIFECDMKHTVLAVDATSQHPAQMVSHYYPINFEKANKKELIAAIRIVKATTIDNVLNNWAQPFAVAFNARIAFTNLRPKENSLFKKEGIYPLASARLFSNVNNIDFEDDASRANFREMLDNIGYKDIAKNARCNFGKLESADYCELYLTELAFWEVCQCYDFDSVQPVNGYITINFRKPTDFTLLSVMRFYKAKNALKETMKDGNAKRIKGLFPGSFVSKIENKTATEQEIQEYYLLAKSDINALFGIEATNECKQDFILSNDGLVLTGEAGLQNMPKHPKCWYQFGQRIVGWSRISQIVAMQLVYEYSDNIICGDTDSLKLYISKNNITKAEKELLKIGKAITKAKRKVCARVRNNYPEYFNSLDEIGYYISEGQFNYFCASWNKSYISSDGENLHIVLAGIPTQRGANSVKALGEKWLKAGATFADVANVLIGYNITYDYSLTKLNGRKHPKFAEMYSGKVTDYNGKTSEVYAPAVLALYPELKTIGDTDKVENAINLDIALANNSSVSYEGRLLDANSNCVEDMDEYNLLDLYI